MIHTIDNKILDAVDKIREEVNAMASYGKPRMDKEEFYFYASIILSFYAQNPVIEESPDENYN